MNWISVKNKLPDAEKEVLCTDGEIMVVTSFTGRWKHPRKKEKPIWNDPTGYYSPLGDIDVYSHWAELPQPPKN